MTKTGKLVRILTMFALALAIATVSASAQFNSNTGTVTINATLPESLTVSLTNPTVTIPLTANTAVNNSTAPVAGTSITTAWVLQPGRTAVKVFVYSTVANPLGNGTYRTPVKAERTAPWRPARPSAPDCRLARPQP